jgi:hypothetical protein
MAIDWDGNNYRFAHNTYILNRYEFSNWFKSLKAKKRLSEKRRASRQAMISELSDPDVDDWSTGSSHGYFTQYSSTKHGWHHNDFSGFNMTFFDGHQRFMNYTAPPPPDFSFGPLTDVILLNN